MSKHMWGLFVNLICHSSYTIRVCLCFNYALILRRLTRISTVALTDYTSVASNDQMTRELNHHMQTSSEV